MKLEEITIWLRDLPQNTSVVSKTDEIINGALKLKFKVSEIQDYCDSYDQDIHQKEILSQTSGPNNFLYIFPTAKPFGSIINGDDGSPSTPTLNSTPVINYDAWNSYEQFSGKSTPTSTTTTLNTSTEDKKRDNKSLFLRILKKKNNEVNGSSSSPAITSHERTQQNSKIATTKKGQSFASLVDKAIAKNKENDNSNKNSEGRLAGGLNQPTKLQPVISPMGKLKNNICFSD